MKNLKLQVLQDLSLLKNELCQSCQGVLPGAGLGAGRRGVNVLVGMSREQGRRGVLKAPVEWKSSEG